MLLMSAIALKERQIDFATLSMHHAAQLLVRRCALFLAPNPLSTFVVTIIFAAVDAQLAFTTLTVSHLTAEPYAMPPSKCIESLLCGIPQQTFPNAYST